MSSLILFHSFSDFFPFPFLTCNACGVTDLESLPLPDGWVAYRDEDDARFFYCETNKTSVYQHPNEALFQEKINAERSKRQAEIQRTQAEPETSTIEAGVATTQFQTTALQAKKVSTKVEEQIDLHARSSNDGQEQSTKIP